MTLENGESAGIASERFMVDFDRQKTEEYRAQADFDA